MDPALALRGFILGFTIAAAVGPISLLVIRRTVAEGRLYGLVSGMGVATADATYGAIAAFGLAAITDVLVNARTVLGLVGGVFLLWLAWQTVRSTPTEAATAAPTRRRGYAGAYLSILALTMANPMTILSFGALFAGLGVTGSATGGALVVVLGVLLGSATWWVVLTTVVSLVRTRLTPVWTHRINVASGLVVGAFALVAIGSALSSLAPRA